MLTREKIDEECKKLGLSEEARSFIHSTIEQYVKEVVGEKVEIGQGTFCLFCKQHIAAGDCSCEGKNKKHREILQSSAERGYNIE